MPLHYNSNALIDLSHQQNSSDKLNRYLFIGCMVNVALVNIIKMLATFQCNSSLCIFFL